MAIKSIRDLDLKGKKVFFRFDFNVPLDDSGTVRDDTRIRAAIPTVIYAMEKGARCILSSHLGRPKGERKPELSLKPVAARLSELLGEGKKVGFVDDCVGPEVEKAVDALKDGEGLLLENLRFHAGEKANESEFAKQLAGLADIYVNDAFGTAHRAHASTVGITEFVKEKAAGLLLKGELENLHKALRDPARPMVAVFGGAKVSDKLGVLQNLLDSIDSILVGGGMANTFLKAKGVDVGSSKVEEDLLDTAADILRSAESKGRPIRLPEDVVVADEMDENAETSVVDVGSIPQGRMALDIGPKTEAAFGEVIRGAGTIVWNGPMGVFEMKPYARGTEAIGKEIAEAAGFSVVGGGDTVRAVHQFGLADNMSYISTGGGAFMEFMEGKTLPGVAGLEG